MRPERRRAQARVTGAQRLRATGCLLALAAMAACASGNNPNPDQTALTESASSEDLPLMAGDAIRLSFSREPGLNGDYAIDETGTASLPLLGARTLTDRPAKTVKKDLIGEYGERTRNQSVQVVYLRRVRPLGEVRSPGLYYVDPTMTFEDVIALAGGATDDGNLRNVSISGSTLAYIESELHRPGALWVWPLDGSEPASKLDDTDYAVAEFDLIAPDKLRLPGHEGGFVEGFLFLPPGARRDGKHPTVTEYRIRTVTDLLRAV